MGMLGCGGFGSKLFSQSQDTLQACLAITTLCVTMVYFLLNQHVNSHLLLNITQKHVLLNREDLCLDAEIYETQKGISDQVGAYFLTVGVCSWFFIT